MEISSAQRDVPRAIRESSGVNSMLPLTLFPRAKGSFFAERGRFCNDLGKISPVDGRHSFRPRGRADLDITRDSHEGWRAASESPQVCFVGVL